MSLIYALIVAFPLVSFGARVGVEKKTCNFRIKKGNPYIKCQNQGNGYIKKTEEVYDVKISYIDQNKKKREVLIPFPLTIADLADSANVSQLARVHGAAEKVSKVKVTSLKTDKNTPLFKDQSFTFLSNGCYFKQPPLVISDRKDKKCESFICAGGVRCKFKKNEMVQEAVCMGSVSKKGVQCPSASECLRDSRPQVAVYSDWLYKKDNTPFSSSGSEGKTK